LGAGAGVETAREPITLDGRRAVIRARFKPGKGTANVDLVRRGSAGPGLDLTDPAVMMGGCDERWP
jgi:hypothetical protein